MWVNVGFLGPVKLVFSDKTYPLCLTGIEILIQFLMNWNPGKKSLLTVSKVF